MILDNFVIKLRVVSRQGSEVRSELEIFVGSWPQPINVHLPDNVVDRWVVFVSEVQVGHGSLSAHVASVGIEHIKIVEVTDESWNWAVISKCFDLPFRYISIGVPVGEFQVKRSSWSPVQLKLNNFGLKLTNGLQFVNCIYFSQSNRVIVRNFHRYFHMSISVLFPMIEFHIVVLSGL